MLDASLQALAESAFDAEVVAVDPTLVPLVSAGPIDDARHTRQTLTWMPWTQAWRKLHDAEHGALQAAHQALDEGMRYAAWLATGVRPPPTEPRKPVQAQAAPKDAKDKPTTTTTAAATTSSPRSVFASRTTTTTTVLQAAVKSPAPAPPAQPSSSTSPLPFVSSQAATRSSTVTFSDVIVTAATAAGRLTTAPRPATPAPPPAIEAASPVAGTPDSTADLGFDAAAAAAAAALEEAERGVAGALHAAPPEPPPSPLPAPPPVEAAASLGAAAASAAPLLARTAALRPAQLEPVLPSSPPSPSPSPSPSRGASSSKVRGSCARALNTQPSTFLSYRVALRGRSGPLAVCMSLARSCACRRARPGRCRCGTCWRSRWAPSPSTSTSPPRR